MSVKRSVLAQKSNEVLETYVAADSRYVADAVRIAYELLLQRGKTFTPEEAIRIQELIQLKTEQETAAATITPFDLDENLTYQSDAIGLYTNELIVSLSFFINIIFGGILLALNYYKLKANKAAIVTITFAILYAILQYTLLYFWGTEQFDRIFLCVVLHGIGAYALYLIRSKIYTIDVAYQPLSSFFPIILVSITVGLVLIYLYTYQPVLFNQLLDDIDYIVRKTRRYRH